MDCRQCGNANPEGSRFCEACGASLAAACAACGTAASPGARFCSGCGTPLETPSAATSVAVPVAERRLVSVLFADLVGFTALSETRDAESVRDLLSRYFDTCRRLIEAYGGTVEKFIGDAVMAVWGTPVATEQDAERAVRAGLDLTAAVSALGQELGAEHLRARVGVLTGEAAVTIGAVGEGMVAGDLVNTAARIQSAAEPGTVLVGELTRSITEATVVYEEAGSFELKGKSGETTLWRAVRVVSGAQGARRSARLEAPFVGRDRELRQMKDTFHATADESRAHLLSVTGIGGIGKSRLAWEFFKYVDGLAQEIWWHQGRCLAYGDGVTYWALADMIRMRCRITEDDDGETVLTKLRATLDEFVLDRDERARLEPSLAQLLGVGEGATIDRLELFAGWRLFFERLADQGPLVMVFEDMQWADSSLLDFVEYLLDWSRSLPIFVVTFARPELLDKRPAWGAGQRSFAATYLEPLSADAMRQMLEGLVPGLPAALVAQILERAEGVPLYAVETVRMLLDRGVLVQHGGAYSATGEIDSLEVPATLQALIASRLDDLPGEERRLLQDAAVLGKTFSVSAVAALSGIADPEPLLRSLARKEILVVQENPLSPEHGQYGFLQDLVRHVAYETLSRKERRTRHLAAADHLIATLPEDEVVEVLASHLVEAAEADPDSEDTPTIRQRAAAALEQASVRAASLGAPSEASRYLVRAAELVDGELRRGDLELRAGGLAVRAGARGTARGLLEAADARFTAASDVERLLRTASLMAQLERSGGSYAIALERLDAALALAGDGEGIEPATLADVHAQLGATHALIGDAAAAVPHLERSLQIAEDEDLEETFVRVLISRGIVAQRLGRLRESELLLGAARDRAERFGLTESWLRAANNLAVVYEMTDRFEESLESGREMLRRSRRIGDRVWEAMSLTGELLPMILLGRWDAALEQFEVAADVGSAGGALTETMLLDVVELLVARGELDGADTLMGRFASGELSDDPQSQSGFLIARARILLARGDAAAAHAVATEALVWGYRVGTVSTLFKLSLEVMLESSLAAGAPAAADELLAQIDGLPPGRRTPWLRAIRARIAALLGDVDEFAKAEALYRELGMRFRLGQVLLAHAEATGDAAPLAEARELFAELRATVWLERAQAAEQLVTIS